MAAPSSSAKASDSKGKAFHLFGFPIAHSFSPALHNTIFDANGTGNHFSTWSTSKVIPEMIDLIRSDKLGGCAVTMPLKSAIIPYLDELTPEAQTTGAVNTIVKVPDASTPGKLKLVGTNTDILGVRNALLSALRSQHPSVSTSSLLRYPPGVGSGVIFGGGATTRSAAYALDSLGLSPIYLINRDVGEIKAVQDAMPHLKLIHLSHPDVVEELLCSTSSTPVLMIVGAIPAFAPVTKEERMVYTTASSILSIPYTKPSLPEGVKDIPPLPTQRLFLEMAYKPRLTPMLKIASAHSWHPIDGIQAMIEQGYAQQRMWARSNPSIQTGSDPNVLGKPAELAARKKTEEMTDIVLTSPEVDLAKDKEAAPVVKQVEGAIP